MSEPTPAELGARFVEVLRQWSQDPAVAERHGPDFWNQMLADNAAETHKDVCHSHDWCDANMAMDAAFRFYGLDPLPDVSSAEAARMMNLWNAAWESAMPALGRKAQ